MPDFSKEVVVLFTEFETEVDTKIAVSSVERFGTSLMIRYRVSRGAKTDHRIRPMEAVIIARGDATEISLTREDGGGWPERIPLR
jgi:hypothetical protein